MNTIDPINFQGKKYPLANAKSLTNKAKKMPETEFVQTVRLGALSALAALGFVKTNKEMSDEKLLKSNRKLYHELTKSKKVDNRGFTSPAYTKSAIVEIIKELRNDKLKGELLKQFLCGSYFMSDAAVKEAVELHRADFKTAHEIKNKYCNGNIEDVIYFNRFQNKAKEIQDFVNEQEGLNIKDKAFIADCLEEFPTLQGEKLLLCRLTEYLQSKSKPTLQISTDQKLDPRFEIYDSRHIESLEILKICTKYYQRLVNFALENYKFKDIPKLFPEFSGQLGRMFINEARDLGIKDVDDQLKAANILANGKEKELQEFLKGFGWCQTSLGYEDLFSEVLDQLPKTIELQESLETYGIEPGICNLAWFMYVAKSKFFIK